MTLQKAIKNSKILALREQDIWKIFQDDEEILNKQDLIEELDFIEQGYKWNDIYIYTDVTMKKLHTYYRTALYEIKNNGKRGKEIIL